MHFLRTAFFLSVFLCVFMSSMGEARAAVRINHLGIAGKTYIGSTPPNPPNLASGLVGHWTFDGPDMIPNVRDKSGQGNHGTLTNFTSTTTAPGRSGQALSFDGTNDYVYVSDNFPLNSSTTTVSFWIQYSTHVNWASIISKSPNTNNTTVMDWGVVFNNANDNVYLIRNGGNVSATSVSIPKNRWVHVVALIGDSETKLYLDGVLSDSQGGVGSGAILNTASRYVELMGSGSFVVTGAMDDARVYNRALTASEVSQLYKIGAGQRSNTTATPPNLQSGLVGHWTFDGSDMIPNVRDVSGQGNHGLLTSGISTTTVAGKSGQAIRFRGNTNEYVVMSGEQVPLNADFTIGGWIRRDPSDSTDIFIGLADAVAISGWSVRLGVAASYAVTGGLITLDNPDLSTGTWHHVIMRRSGDTFQLFLNGTASVSGTQSGSLRGNDYLTFATRYGAGGGGPYYQSEFAIGSVDDVRIYNRALSAAEILQLYNLGR